ncbi:MAG TPA: divalent-cation tolerance protein CutA [Leptospiraceae bacterium]|nr:divalent-cation tolerance protein CutA [Leptospiraceae bacterium]HMZ57478.1 divalent-cation tolerance protein CutA [Leptospiraceae bacterium]HNH07025.1 divalent-cation tolerance protein CutA [Leptospiraceae bacterium]HNI96567.1 divalent-cation tolerance protein CutA [Leptospiraceae bacterium]HNM05802.1 divalent-cation tolerance protein CutA [Leptospiraceae bacterium]
MKEETGMAYITCSSIEEAMKMGEILVKDRIAACANIIPKMISLYIWKNELEKSEEAVLITKILKKNYAKLETRVKELHSYTVPCILYYPSSAGYPPYIQWMIENSA